MSRSLYLLLFFTFIHNLTLSQNLYINSYTQKEYSSEDYVTSPQNWGLEQDTLGRLYVTNNSGVLLFDGLRWEMISGTEYHKLFLARSSDNTIYAGGGKELGFFKTDSLGNVIFESLLPTLQKENFNSGEIKGLKALKGSIFFKTEDGIIELKDKSFSYYALASKHHEMEELEDTLIIQDNNGNFLGISSQTIDTVFSIKNGLNSDMKSLIKISSNQTLLFTKDSGVFEIHGSKIQKWNSRISDYLAMSHIEDIIHFDDLNMVGISTTSEGILFIDYDGNLIKTLGTNEGLISNLCHNFFKDANNNLWACFDNGISKIEYPSDLTYYNHANGLHGLQICVVEDDNTIYAGSNNGLFILNEKNQFNSTNISQEVWDLQKINNTIWVASSEGLFQIINKDVFPIVEVNARTIIPSADKNKLWVGTNDGLGSIVYEDGNWMWQGKIEGLSHEVRYVTQESDSILWASYESVSKISLAPDQSEVIEVKTMTEENGFSDDFYVIESYNLRDEIFFGTGIGVLSINETSNKLKHNPTFGTRFIDSNHDALALAEDTDHNIWLSSNRTVGKLIFENNRLQSWDTLAFARLKSTDVWRIVPSGDFVYFCTTNGLFKYDTKIKKNINSEYYSLINQIEVNRDSIISYMVAGEENQRSTLLPFSSNDIRFNCTATSYNADEEIKFSYLLEGYDESWSSWIPESSKEYTNLPPGEYKFKVKAKNLYGIDSKITAYPFDILPPWYRTYWAYAIGILILVTCGIGIERIQRKRLFKRQQAKIKIQQRKLEQEREISNKLRKVDKLKDDFLANTSHELRTPLNGIIGISESLYEECLNIGNKENCKNLSLVISSGKRLASLVNSILDYSKLKTENLDIRIKDIDLKSVVEIVISMSKPLISDASIHLKNAIPNDFSLVKADENRLQQILYNLVGNAIKFSEHGTIIVEAQALDNFVEISVKDEGIGIPADKLEDIFESYEQLESTISREYIGTGLGLTVSKKLVELHGGKMSVTSTPGKGSIFKFTIPRAKSFANKEDTQQITDPGETTDLNSKILSKNAQFDILIVDDEPINRQVITNHLKNEPYNLYLASNGADALNLIENQKFDLVLLDVMMPRMSGFEVCVKIREKYLISELPIIFITAKDQIMDLVEGFDYGGNDYLTKPFSKQEFMARIKTHLNLFKVNDSYSRFIPFEFLRSLGRESIIDVNLGDQIEKEVTVLFSDIRDYTTISEAMSPKENFEFLNSFLGEMGPVIQKNHGFVMQYLGDGLMSIFLNSPDNAVAAASEMLQQTIKYNDRKESENHQKIKVGIGIHTGKLIFGVIGDKKRMSVNVVSDTVNTASRMEGLTKHYGASNIISENTLDQLKSKDEIKQRFLGLVKVKGKSNPLKIYEILDGLESVEGELKISTKEVFENGLAYYFNKDFINAASEFKKVVTLNPADVSAQMYLKLAAKYMVENVPENWTGVETMILK